MRGSSRHLLALGVVVLVATAGVLASGAPGAVQSDAGIAADDAGAGVPTGEVNSSDADATIEGAANGSFGKSAAYAGDLNGDGHDDVVVGAPFDDTRGTFAGAAHVFFGPVDGNATLNASDADVTLFGESGGDQAGWSVTAGDFDGDGYDDLVVSAVYGDRGGVVYVVRGGEELPKTANLSAADLTIEASNEGDFGGYDVAVVRDAVGEPGDDLVVGAPRNDAAGEDAGAVYVFDGGALEETNEFDEAAAVLRGEAPGDWAGSSVDAAGDVDGDDRPDLVVGAPRYGNETAGAAYVVSDLGGATDASNATNATAVSLANATRLVGAASWDRAGWSVAGVRDVNGDGYDDVAVGAPTSDGGGHASGAVHVVFGGADLPANASLADANATYYGPAADDRAGRSVAGPGDVTCDGLADVLVGAPRWNADEPAPGAAYLVGGNASLPAAEDLSNATTRFAGSAPGDLTGWAVASAGGPGHGVLVGAPGTDDEAGAASLFLSGCPGSTSTGPSTTTPTATPSNSSTAGSTSTETSTPTGSPSPTDAPTATSTPTATPTPPPTSTTATPTDTPSGTADDPAETTRDDSASSDRDGTTTTATGTPAERSDPVGPLTITAGLAMVGTLTALLARRRL